MKFIKLIQINSRFKGLLHDAGDIVRLSFFTLLIVFFLSVILDITPLTDDWRVPSNELTAAVIIMAVLSALFPRKPKPEGDDESEPRAKSPAKWWLEVALALVAGAGAGLIVVYTVGDIRLSNLIAGITGFLVLVITLNYRLKS